jgi:PAS domain S-box-containing protein
MEKRNSTEGLRRIFEDLTSQGKDPVQRAQEMEELARTLLDHLEAQEIKSAEGPARTEFLWDFARRVSTLKDPRDLLEDIVDLLVAKLGIARCSIFLRDCEGNHLEFQTGRGVDEKVREASIPIGEGIAGSVARSGKPLLVPDIQKDRRFENRDPSRYPTGTFICAPLVADGEVLGVINVSGKENGSEFTVDDLHVLSGLGEAAGKAFQNALHHNETEESGIFIANVMESLNLGLLVVDPDGRVRLANSEFLRLFELDREGVMGRTCCSAVGSHLAEPLNRLLNRAWQEGGDQQVRLMWERKNGESLPLRVGVTLFRNREMDIIGTLVTFDDLSQSHELDEIRKLEKIKSNFVSTVSHELRTPLASMIGSISLLRSGVMGDVNEKQARLLDILHRNSYRLKELIEDILDLSRLESEEVSLLYEEANLLELAREAAATSQEITESKDIDLTLEESLDLRVRVDPTKIQRVFLNLLGNAVKFTPPGGRVTVRAKQDGDMVTVSVEDTGAGIPEQEQEKVFEKFYQVGDALVRTNPGSGLGLAICRSVIAMHGGEIGVRHAPGGGSLFWFRIPIRGEASPHDQQQEQEAFPSRKIRS